MRAKIPVAILLMLAALAVGMYALRHHSKPAATTGVTPQTKASASPSSAQTPDATSTATAQCRTADLSFTINQTGGGTAGTTYRQAVFTNHSSHACIIGGFPGVSLVDEDDQQQGQPATHNGPSRPSFVLAPGHAAVSVIGFPNSANFQPDTCSESSINLKVYPPGQTTALEAPLVAKSCPGFSVQALQAQ